MTLSLGARVLFLLLSVMPFVHSEADRRDTCQEAKHQYTEGFVVYSELLLASAKKEIKRLMEECNVAERSGTIVTKGLDDCINAQDNIEKDILAMTEEKADLEEEVRRLQLLHAMQLKDLCTIRQSLEIAQDCADIQLRGSRRSGFYDIARGGAGDPVNVLCDLQTNGGGWTVFLNRDSQMAAVSFNRSWLDYKKGFGEQSSGFWLGNELLHILTSGDEPVTLRVEAKDLRGDTKWGEWNVFKVDSEEHKYQLTVEKQRATSTLGDSLEKNNGCRFSTWDQDNDNFNVFECAHGHSGTGGWWYNKCGNTRPTGDLSAKEVDTSDLVYWAYWGNWTHRVDGDRRLVQSISMKLRRRHYSMPSSLKIGNLC
uniref:Ficolin n=1 Tax=Macrobrachium rosenbergii TaxID=79674 RepID=A0A5K5D8I1_MACRS|nr:ficolin [Macrobrachium rosenbergii]